MKQNCTGWREIAGEFDVSWNSRTVKVYERKIATFSFVIMTGRRYYVHGTFAQNRNRTWRQRNGSCNSSCNPRQYHPDINMPGDGIVTYFTNDLLIPQRVPVRIYNVYVCIETVTGGILARN